MAGGNAINLFKTGVDTLDNLSEKQGGHVARLKVKLQRIQSYVDDLENDDPPTKPEEWEKIIRCLKDSTLISADLLDQLAGYDESVKELNTIRDDMEEIKKNGHMQESRIQQFEDRGQRALDFIYEHGLNEQFRRYYEKKKQTNVVFFPQDS